MPSGLTRGVPFIGSTKHLVIASGDMLCDIVNQHFLLFEQTGVIYGHNIFVWPSTSSGKMGSGGVVFIAILDDCFH